MLTVIYGYLKAKYKPFSYQEIQRIKEDLGDYLEDPEKYIRAFKGVTLLYDLTWKDVMYILGQTLTPYSKTRVLGKAVAYGDESEKAMVPHSSTLAWKIPRTEEPGRLQSIGSLRVGHN